MGIRGLEELRREQEAVLAAWRSRGASSSSRMGMSVGMETLALVGKVTSVVASDPTYGAHVVVSAQQFTGAPPSAGAASRPTMRAYPTPNRVVGDYAVNEFVWLATVRGAVLAGKMG